MPTIYTWFKDIIGTGDSAYLHYPVPDAVESPARLVAATIRLIHYPAGGSFATSGEYGYARTSLAISRVLNNFDSIILANKIPEFGRIEWEGDQLVYFPFVVQCNCVLLPTGDKMQLMLRLIR